MPNANFFFNLKNGPAIILWQNVSSLLGLLAEVEYKIAKQYWACLLLMAFSSLQSSLIKDCEIYF